MTVDTVLVTGAFGQIGKRCTEILLSRGRTVVATDLRTEKTAAVAQELPDQTHAGTLVPVYADLLDAAAIQEFVAEYRPGAIMHLTPISPSLVPIPVARKVESTSGLASPDSSTPRSQVCSAFSSRVGQIPGVVGEFVGRRRMNPPHVSP